LVRTLLALLLLDSSSAVAVPHAPTRPQSRRLHRLPVMAADGDSSSDSSVKISIKPRSAVSETAVEGGQVSVKVRPASERAAAAAADSDTDMTTTIKVTKAPQAATAPKAPEVLRSPAEEMLLNGTQAANVSRILEALKAGANPNICDPKGRTPLHFMAGVGLAPAMVLLIHFGAQLNVRDNDGLTPLHMAAGYANARSLRVLIAAGADPNIAASSQGRPLEVVKQMGEYQWDQVYGENKKKRELFKPKKDEKLEKLKACVTTLSDPEKVREEEDWDDLVLGALRVTQLSSLASI